MPWRPANIDALALGDRRTALLSLSSDRIERWDLRRHVATGRWPHVYGEFLATPDDGRLLVTPDGKVIDLASGKATHRSLTQGEPTAVALSHDGEQLAAGDDSGWVTLWDRRTWRRLGELPIGSAVASDGDGSEGVSAMAFSHDGKTLAARHAVAVRHEAAG